jgi:hypothetical protein
MHTSKITQVSLLDNVTGLRLNRKQEEDQDILLHPGQSSHSHHMVLMGVCTHKTKTFSTDIINV